MLLATLHLSHTELHRRPQRQGVITLTTWTAKSLIASIGQTFTLYNGRYTLINGENFRAHITPQSSLIKLCVYY